MSPSGNNPLSLSFIRSRPSSRGKSFAGFAITGLISVTFNFELPCPIQSSSLRSCFHEFLKTFIQQFIQLEVTIEGRLFERPDKLRGHPELKRNKLRGGYDAPLPHCTLRARFRRGQISGRKSDSLSH